MEYIKSDKRLIIYLEGKLLRIQIFINLEM